MMNSSKRCLFHEFVSYSYVTDASVTSYIQSYIQDCYHTLLFRHSSIAVWIIITEFLPDCCNISVIVFNQFFDSRPAWYSVFLALAASPIWSRNSCIGFHSLNELYSSCVLLGTNVYTNNYWISEFCSSVSSCLGRSQLRSATVGNLVVPQILTKTIGIRGFSYSCLSIWNSLPAHLKDKNLTYCTSFQKTFMFKC